VPFAALSATYFAHIGFFNPYLPLWLKDLGFGIVAISLLTSVQSGTRLFAPYVWGWLSDHSGERVKLLRYGATVALVASCGLWFPGGMGWLAAVLTLMFLHTSAMMPMSEAAMAHLVSSGGTFDAKRYGRVRLWGSLGFLVTVFAAGAWFEHYGMGHFPAWTVASLLLVVASAWALPDLKESLAAHERKQPVLPILKSARCSGSSPRCSSMCWRTWRSTSSSRCIWMRWATARPSSACCGGCRSSSRSAGSTRKAAGCRT